jgi:hypothetical protein
MTPDHIKLNNSFVFGNRELGSRRVSDRFSHD